MHGKGKKVYLTARRLTLTRLQKKATYNVSPPDSCVKRASSKLQNPRDLSRVSKTFKFKSEESQSVSTSKA